MTNPELLLHKLANRELYLKIFEKLGMASPLGMGTSVIKRQKRAIDIAKRNVQEYEASHGKINPEIRRKAYLDYLTSTLGKFTLEQYSVRCKNCTHLYEDGDKFPGPEDFERARGNESELEELFRRADILTERGCPLHPHMPDEMTPGQECPDYHAVSEHAEAYDLKEASDKIDTVRAFIAEIQGDQNGSN